VPASVEQAFLAGCALSPGRMKMPRSEGICAMAASACRFVSMYARGTSGAEWSAAEMNTNGARRGVLGCDAGDDGVAEPLDGALDAANVSATVMAGRNVRERKAAPAACKLEPLQRSAGQQLSCSRPRRRQLHQKAHSPMSRFITP
jgi:hypothetical protein